MFWEVLTNVLVWADHMWQSVPILGNHLFDEALIKLLAVATVGLWHNKILLGYSEQRHNHSMSSIVLPHW